MRYILLLPPLWAGLALFAPNLSAKSSKQTLNATSNTPLFFLENKGQITNQYQQKRNDINFCLHTGKDLNLFVGAGKLEYQWSRPAVLEPVERRNNSKCHLHSMASISSATGDMYRVDVQLIGANTQATVTVEEQQSYREQQYYISAVKTVTIMHSYQKIRYTNIYPHIDWVLYTKDGTMKYDFVIHPGGNPSDIRIRYSGATALSLQQDGSLNVASPMGSIGEQAPISYTHEGKAVGSHFMLQDSTVSFAVDDYSGTLVIDPELSWSTYYGGLENDNIDAVSVDAWGNTYVSGYTLSTDNIATTGAFQTTFAGSDIFFNAGDAFIAKYNCSGEQLWATYYGGEAAERAWNVKADEYGNIYVAGFTNLLSGIPSTDNLATTGSHQPSPGGSDGDLFLAKFDSSGSRIWATYYGGSGKENSPTLPVGLALDKYGHVYLCGTTNSTDAIATTGAYQTAIAGGNDAFLVQFDTAGVRQWATYYGDSGNDRGTSIACDTVGNIYLSGITNSTSNIASTAAHQTASGGGNDAFLVKFNSSGMRQWATYYGGTGNADEGMSLYTDTSLHIYMAGRTNSTNGISTTGSFQDAYGGGLYDAFLVKFDGEGIRQWGTYFGGMNNGSLQGYNALTGDRLGNIFMTGIAKATDSLATPGSFQETVAGAEDGFLAKFTSGGMLDWATYYGGAGSDFFNAIATDPLGNLYLAGATTSDAAFATPGSAQDVLTGGNDAFLLKFNDTTYIPAMDTVYGPTVVCAHTEQTYSVHPVPGATGYTWTLPSGWIGTSDSTSITVTTNETGGFVTVLPTFPCANGSGYSLSVAVINAVITPLTDTTGCAGDTLQLNANTGEGFSWQWLQNDAALAGAIDSLLPVYSSGLYNVVISKSGCTDTSDAISVTIHELPVVSVTIAGDTLTATSGYLSYQWCYEGDDITGAVSDIYLPVVNGTYTVKVTDTNGCEAVSESVMYEQPTRIIDRELLNSINIYPNPATHRINIKANKRLIGRITTIEGRLMAAMDAPGSMDIGSLAEGIYILLLTEPNGQFVKAYKLVKSASR